MAKLNFMQSIIIINNNINNNKGLDLICIYLEETIIFASLGNVLDDLRTVGAIKTLKVYDRNGISIGGLIL